MMRRANSNCKVEFLCTHWLYYLAMNKSMLSCISGTNVLFFQTPQQAKECQSSEVQTNGGVTTPIIWACDDKCGLQTSCRSVCLVIYRLIVSGGGPHY